MSYWKELSFGGVLVFVECLHVHETTLGMYIQVKQFAFQSRSNWFVGDKLDSLTLHSIFLSVNYYFCLLCVCP